MDRTTLLKKRATFKYLLFNWYILRIFIPMRITKDNIHEFIKGTTMSCDNYGITHIDYIPDNIKYFYCYTNNLTKLPKLPDSLMELYCDRNKLTSLPKLPESLTRLYCQNNKLTSLPKLPESLTRLYCQNNKLTSLPKLPESLIHLNCSNNNLPYEVSLGNLKEHNKLLKRKQILKRICA